MRRVPNAGEQNSEGAFGISEEALRPEAPDERKRFKEEMNTVPLRMMRKEVSSWDDLRYQKKAYFKPLKIW